MYVDGQLCYGFPNSTDRAALDALPEMIHVTCNPPLTGQVVKFERHGQGSVDSYKNDYYVNICEVQVWGTYARTCRRAASTPMPLSVFLVASEWLVTFY